MLSHCTGEENVRICFAYFGNINTRQFVVTGSELLTPEGVVVVDRAARSPREDSVESASAYDLGRVIKRIFDASWFYGIQSLSHSPQRARKSSCMSRCGI